LAKPKATKDDPMDATNRQDSDRCGRTAPSNTGRRKAGRTQTIQLGDIHDLRAYVGRIATTLTRDEDEREELILEGIALAFQRSLELAPGESLQRALSHWLESRLRDRWRKEHREWRRDSRAGTAYALPLPTGLAWEHGNETTDGGQAINDLALAHSRLNLRPITREQDLYDSRIIGRINGVPSAAAIATATAREIWATIKEERALSDRQRFHFLKEDDLDHKA